MAGIKIELLSDVKSMLRGTTDVEGALDKVADSLDGVAREAKTTGTQAGSDLAKGVDRGTTTAGNAVEDLERTFKDMTKAVQRSAADTGDDIGRQIKRGTKEAEAGTEDLKRNAASNAKETAASFSGSADDIASGFQGLAAEAFEGFGPAGIIAGAAAAAGLGALWTSIQENTEASKKRVEDMFADFVESGNKMLSQQFINTELQKIYSGADDARISMKSLRQEAEETGVSESLLARAYAGDQGARKVAIEAVQEALDGVAAAAESTDKRTRDSGQARQADLAGWMDSLQKTEREYESAQERVSAYNEAVDAVPRDITTRVSADTGQGVLSLDELRRRAATTPLAMAVTVDAAAAQRSVDDVVRKLRPIDLPASLRIRVGQTTAV